MQIDVLVCQQVKSELDTYFVVLALELDTQHGQKSHYSANVKLNALEQSGANWRLNFTIRHLMC